MESSRILTWRTPPKIIKDGNKDSRVHFIPDPSYNSHSDDNPHSHSHSTPKPKPPPPSPQKSRPAFWTEIPRSSRPNYNLHSPDSPDSPMTDDDGVFISDAYKPPNPDPEQQHHNQQHHNQQQQEQQQQRQQQQQQQHQQHHHRHHHQQQRVPKPSLAPKASQWIPTKEWVSSFKARIADPIELPPPPPPTPRPLSSFDAHVKATLRRLNRNIDKSGPQLPPSDNSSDSDNSNGPPRIKKYKNRFIHGPNYEPYKDMAQSGRGIKSSSPPHLQPLNRPQLQTQTQTDTTELPDADVEAALTEMSGPDEDLNNYIYSLRKESCERLASAWQSIFDRFGNSDIDEEGSEVDFAVEDYIPKSKENYGRRKRHKLRANAKPRKPEENVFVAQDSDNEEDIYSSEEEGEEEDEDEGEGEEFYEDDDEEKEEEVYESLGELETEEEEDEEKFVKTSTDRLGRFLKDEDEDEGEETVRVWRERIQHEQRDEEGNTKDAAVVDISDNSNPPSPSRHRTRTHRPDRHLHNHHYHHRRRRQDQEEQDRSDRSHHIPEDRQHHHSDSSRLFNLFDSPDTDRRWKEENRVSGLDVDIQAKSGKRYSHSGRARHPTGEDEEAAAKGTVVSMDDYQTESHRRDEGDSVDTFNFRWDQPRYGPLPKPGGSDLMIMRRAFNKWRWYSASRHDCSARNRGDPQEVSGEEDVVEEREEVVNDEEAAYDGDESNTEVEQEYQCVQPRRQQQQQQQRKEEEFSPVASVVSPTATKGLTFESTALYNRSGTLRLHMKPQTRALAAALSPRKRVSPTPLRLLDTASGLNPFAAGDSNWRLSDVDGMQSSPPPFSDSPSPTGNLWSPDAFPDFSVAGSPMTTPRRRQTQQPPEFDLSTPKALRFMSINDLYRLQDEGHESVPFSNPSRTAEQEYTRLIIPASPPTLPKTTTHQQDYGFFDSPSSFPSLTTATALSSSVEALYNAATGSEFATSTFLPRQQPEGPPVPALVLDEVEEELLREMSGLSTAMGTPRKSRAVVDPLEARLMTPKTKALASLLMSKKKIPSSPSSRSAAGAQLPALVSDYVFGSGSVPTLSSTVTATPPISSSATTPISSSATTPNPSISPSPPPPLLLPQPPLPSRSAAGAGAPLFQMHTGYPMGERGTKRQYGQDDDDDGDDDDGLESFKVVKSESQYGMFHSPRPLS
ncbi:hypothetical protein KI688_011186 [Linnemannia hyalina]|uniref:Uncharacterized protein n=1 Tax=Linnemannia hyalina TaxID=64524 RepID=A0A9P7XWY8_9FUNG|nr:hypothetical protein KI688_011186 [Linnemannia hyalina]